jgi:hypothetical protein
LTISQKIFLGANQIIKATPDTLDELFLGIVPKYFEKNHLILMA